MSSLICWQVCANASDPACNQYTYSLRVCSYSTTCAGGNLPYGATPTVSACQIPLLDGSLQYAGYYAAMPSYEGGFVTLRYTDPSSGLCHHQFHRSTLIQV